MHELISGETLRKKRKNLKILIVEDEPAIRELLLETLDEFGIGQIYQASNGKEAMRYMKVHRILKRLDASQNLIDLIICDWNMPFMDGLEFLQRVRATYPTLPFLMLTGNCTTEFVETAKEAGVNAFIRKPFSPDQLKIKINSFFI